MFPSSLSIKAQRLPGALALVMRLAKIRTGLVTTAARFICVSINCRNSYILAASLRRTGKAGSRFARPGVQDYGEWPEQAGQRPLSGTSLQMGAPGEGSEKRPNVGQDLSPSEYMGHRRQTTFQVCPSRPSPTRKEGPQSMVAALAAGGESLPHSSLYHH